MRSNFHIFRLGEELQSLISTGSTRQGLPQPRNSLSCRHDARASAWEGAAIIFFWGIEAIMSLLVDSHCHLDYDGLREDLDAVLERAEAVGIGAMLTISTRLSKFAGVLAIAEKYDNIFCSVGVHPHEAEKEADVTTAQLLDLAQHPKCIAIGETGLDYFYEHSPRQLQQNLFRGHIAAARETGLPLIVHTREAEKDTADILADEMEKGAFPALLHCFSSSQWLAEQALELGLTLSISGIVTFKNAEALRQTVCATPLARLLVETDAPYLAPVPHRGRPNEPAFVADTAAKVAELKGLTRAELARATSDNFFQLFGKAVRPAAMSAAMTAE
jgi:TatD DNase family protein